MPVRFAVCQYLKCSAKLQKSYGLLRQVRHFVVILRERKFDSNRSASFSRRNWWLVKNMTMK